MSKLRPSLPGNPEKLSAIPMRWFSKYERKTAFTDDLFVSMPKYMVNKVEGWVSEKRSGSLLLRFNGVYRLTIQDETVMLGVLSYLSKAGSLLPVQDLDLDPPGVDRLHAVEKKVGVVKISRKQILELCGMKNTGQNYQQLRNSLDRLSTVSVFYRNEETKWEGRDWFFSYRANDDGRLTIKVNWRLAGAALGQNTPEGSYLFISIDMDERLALSTDAAKKLHVVLSRHVWHGTSERFRLETLISHVWLQPTESVDTIRERRVKIKKALKEIDEFSAWRIKITGRGEDCMVDVERAPLPSQMKNSVKLKDE